jgi:hypothetical protein
MARVGSAQYNAQILLPPAEFSQPGALTNAFAMNESGQVLGEVTLFNNDRRPVVWTDGVGVALPIPDGYYWFGGFEPSGYQFINNSGLVVGRLRIANGIPNSNWDESRVVVWQNGVPQVLPMPDSCGQSGTGHQFAAPYGLNNLGHILVGTYGDTPCGKLWLWDGSGYQLFFDNANGDIFNIGTPARTHLNDADHVAIDRLPGGLSPICDSNHTITGTMIGTQFTPITGGSALQINNHDQVLLYCTGAGTFLKLWDGAALVDFGIGGAASVNDLGHVVFFGANIGPNNGLKIYKDGVVSDLPLPKFSETASFVGGALINSSGQIVVVESLAYGGTNQAVLFTPRTPVITWPKPADITYGTALGLAQLNATANVPGTFAYNPPAGTVLSAAAIQLLSVTFTPDNPVLYDPTTASNSIGVLPAPLTVTADDANKVFGAPLPALSASFIGFVNGDGPGSLLGSLTLTTGATSTSPPGAYPITASGVSSPNYSISFVPGTLTIAPANTTTTAFAFPTTTAFLQPFYLVATVAAVAPGAGVPDGVVQFKEGASVVGSATLVNGTAVLAMNGVAPGAHSFMATYQASSNFAGSTFAPIAVTVQSVPASTFTLLFPINNLQLAGQPASFAALVIPLGGGTATGTVQFMDGNTTLGSAPLSGGVAVFSTNALAAGLHAIGARYVGAGGRLPSTSPLQLQTIYTGARPTATVTTLASSLSPSTLDQPVTFTATVTGGATTGEVYFLGDGLPLGHAPIADAGGSMQAALTVSNLPVGAHIVTALYLGGPGSAASSSGVPAVQVVQSAGGAADATMSSQLLESIRSVLRR